MPRFVILRHETPPHAPRPLHWDLMFERNAKLVTWALADEPAPGKNVDAELLADHRMEYLEFEGELTKGRGTVRRWDAGTFSVEQWDDERITVLLSGMHLRQCQVELTRDSGATQRWSVDFSSG